MMIDIPRVRSVSETRLLMPDPVDGDQLHDCKGALA
jgi:hypothetical protein